MFDLAIIKVLSLLLIVTSTDGEYLEASAFKNPHFVHGREVMVQLFEWKWKDIADECERFLGPKGYAGVQTSPVTENLIIPSRPWFERFQPISYRWRTRSGNETEFKDMVRRCNNVGVRIYVELILNHMTQIQPETLGTGGSTADAESRYYPAVPYSSEHFHPHCLIEDWSDVKQIRDCYTGAHDLNESHEHVMWTMVGLMDDLIDVGVAGFRIAAAGAMWPDKLEEIFANLQPLKTNHGFAKNSRPYICQSVIDTGGAPISKYEYSPFTVVTEYRYSMGIAEALNGPLSLKWFDEFVKSEHLLLSDDALIFVDDPELQRARSIMTMTHKSPKLYKMANAFMLAHPYGRPIIMSSYAFDDDVQGPPMDERENIVSPIIKDDGSCAGGWVCEHRWRQISNMIGFRQIVDGTTLDDCWSDVYYNQFAFSRGDQGFIAFNAEENYHLYAMIRTKLPEGSYCDVISGNFANNDCSGKIVRVDGSGNAVVFIPFDDENGVVAIHRNVSIPEFLRKCD